MSESGNISVDIENTFGKSIKGVWGIFKIVGSQIEIERYKSSINGCETTIYERGEILNNTSFVLNLRELRRNGRVRSKEEITSRFFFRALTHKPDSTNSFL